jgi:hypothetical protein
MKKKVHPLTYLKQKGYKVTVHKLTYKSKQESYDNPARYVVYITKESFKIPADISVANNRYSGCVWADEVGPNRLETHSHLSDRFKGRGIGSYIYSKLIDRAMKDGWSVSSSNSRNANSHPLWLRLNILYSTRYCAKTDRFYVLSKLKTKNKYGKQLAMAKPGLKGYNNY